MLIRREMPSDAQAVHHVHEAAFGRELEARIADDLRAAGDARPALSLVAEIDGAVAGHVVCSDARIGDLPSVGLGPVSVLPAHQGRGVGTALLHAVLGAADALDLPEIVLLGSPAFYRRFGFQPAQPLRVLPPDPAWAEHFQIRTLTAWTPGRKGAFRYAPAFPA
jgi:putative acetyltransferase